MVSRWWGQKRAKVEGSPPGTLGDADEPSGGVVGFIIEISMKEGAHLMTPMKSLALVDTQPTAGPEFGMRSCKIGSGREGSPQHFGS